MEAEREKLESEIDEVLFNSKGRGDDMRLLADFIESREKNLYPEEFLTWSNRNAYFDGKLWSIFTDEENEDIAEFTLPELFEYWKSEINKKELPKTREELVSVVENFLEKESSMQFAAIRFEDYLTKEGYV